MQTRCEATPKKQIEWVHSKSRQARRQTNKKYSKYFTLTALLAPVRAHPRNSSDTPAWKYLIAFDAGLLCANSASLVLREMPAAPPFEDYLWTRHQHATHILSGRWSALRTKQTTYSAPERLLSHRCTLLTLPSEPLWCQLREDGRQEYKPESHETM